MTTEKSQSALDKSPLEAGDRLAVVSHSRLDSYFATIARWRNETYASWFEAIQVIAVGVYVLTLIAPYVDGLRLSTPLYAHAGLIQLMCNAFFVLDALVVLGYALAQRVAEPKFLRASQNLKAWSTFLFDCALVLLSVLRPLRVLRPILVLRRFSSATEHSTRGKNRTRSKNSSPYWVLMTKIFSRSRYAVLFLYSFLLITTSDAVLVLQAEKREGSLSTIHTLGDALWFCVGEVTLTGSQYNPITLEARLYTLLLLALGLATAGIFASSFRRIFEESLSSKEVGFDDQE
jgi:hypothetical protein